MAITCTKFLLEGVLNEMLSNTMTRSTALFTAAAGSTDQLARTVSWTTIALHTTDHSFTDLFYEGVRGPGPSNPFATVKASWCG